MTSDLGPNQNLFSSCSLAAMFCVHLCNCQVSVTTASRPTPTGRDSNCGEGCTPVGLGDSAPAETESVASCSWKCVLERGRVSESFDRLTCAFQGVRSGRDDQNPQVTQSFICTNALPLNFLPSTMFPGTFPKTRSG
uniref:Secreted protein n=1 Tax=Myotis myotis TaxID=51298 RepID=A0A7J8ALS9_MYOMY|nr:hypothetical protein mMyoMyo1_007837 [Myotis myotis]